VISVLLSEWINWLQQHASLSLTAALILVIFLALYGITDWRTRTGLRSRLEHLEKSLKLYAAVSAPLLSNEGPVPHTPEQEDELIDRLLACRAAPYATPDLLGQIGAYIVDRDKARLPLLLRTIERESDRFIDERDKLLVWLERPGWGHLFWLRLKPVFPFLFAVALFVLICQMLQHWTGTGIGSSASNTLDTVYFYLRFGSALFSLLLLYPALMGGFRPSERSILLRIWAFLIAALYLLYLASPVLIPYIVGAQILLFLGGFLYTKSKPRKTRPFVGHYPANNLSDSEADSLDAKDITQPSAIEQNSENFINNDKDR
jgi:hypothetical protein